MLALLKIIAGQVASAIGGFAGWFWGKILFYGGQAILDLVNDWVRKAKRASEQKKAEDTLNKVDQDPSSKPEDVAKAYEDYINTGRKE